MSGVPFAVKFKEFSDKLNKNYKTQCVQAFSLPSLPLTSATPTPVIMSLSWIAILQVPILHTIRAP